ncbi:TetR/AcrR family transcriptional regulator [Janibacter sp. G1551]|uniref:TetR/AcrR family transcriptional regulator n=1 Tax=Janibacter sp. G1551 TaxID=3420440 RepID=UPI003D074D65
MTPVTPGRTTTTRSAPTPPAPVPDDRPGRRPRGYLSAETILQAAFDVAEEQTVDDLSMPKLAKRLGVGVTSLYWYYRSKDELLEAMTGEAARRYLMLLPEHDDKEWDERLRFYFRGMKQVFRENPVVCDLLAFRRSLTTPGAAPRFFDRLDREVASLLAAGFDPATAAAAYQSMSVFTQGVVQRQRLFDLDARAREAGGAEPAPSRVWALELAPPGETYPGLERTMKHWSHSFASDSEFEAGLTFMIDGLRARLAS